MSAWVVSKAHIDAMVSSALNLGGGSGERCFSFSDKSLGQWRRTEVSLANATEIGTMLWAENVKSVNYRYADSDHIEPEVPEPYTFTRTRTLTDGEIVALVRCYDYQSCEHAEWEGSPAHAFCQAIEYRLLSRIPGVDDAPWGFSEEQIRWGVSA